jgi:hypothetical protein
MVLCEYIYLNGHKKGERCNRLIKTQGSTYCYAHKAHQGRQEKYKDKIEVIKKNKPDSNFRFEQDVRRHGGTPKKQEPNKDINKLIYDRLEKKLSDKYDISDDSESIEESNESIEPEENLKPVYVPPQPKIKNNLNDEELIDEFYEAVQNRKLNSKSLLEQLKRRKVITTEEYNNLLSQI